MKNAFTISLLVFAALVPLYTAETADAKEIVESPSNWTRTFQTRIGTIEHTPDSVIYRGRAYTGDLQIPEIFNGHILDGPLIVNYSLSEKAFVKALKKSGLLESFSPAPVVAERKPADWERLFHTSVGEIDHNPERTKIGNINNSSKITLRERIGGYFLSNTLVLDHNVSEEEFIKSLEDAGIILYSN